MTIRSMINGKGSLRVYGCGGCGINIASHFTHAESTDGYADISTVFVDTSHSNLNAQIPEESCYIIDDVDGSGKVRRDNHLEIVNNVNNVLQKYPAEHFNIVIFSASGGSGSVLGPLIVKELLNTGHPAIVITVGSSESAITAQNTLNTLKSLESIGRTLDRPIVMSYHHNGNGDLRSNIDHVVIATINSIAALCSHQNDELDSRDIANWLFYNHSTKVPAQLSLLEVCNSVDVAKEISAPISVASLLKSKDTPPPDLLPEYSCIGYREDGFGSKVEEIHYVITLDGIGDLTKKRVGDVSEYNAATRSRLTNIRPLLNEDDHIEDDGLIL